MCEVTGADERLATTRAPAGVRLTVGWASQILRLKAGMLGDAGQHLGADLLGIVKCKDHIRPAIATQSSMRSGLPLQPPTDSE